MRRLIALTRFLPLGAETRRAIAETLADGWHEAHSASGAGTRSLRWLMTMGAIARVVGFTLSVFDQGHPMKLLTSDARFAMRRLRKSPTFAIFSVITLALGIGATTAIYSIVHAVMSPPPAVANIDRIVNVYHSRGGSLPMMSLSWGDYQAFRARQTVFEKVTGWHPERFAFAANGRADSSFGEYVGGDYFDVLGVPVALGRAIQPPDDEPTAPTVAVISHRLWQRLFDAAPDVIGRTLRLNGVPVQIVGVASRDFNGLFNSGIVASGVWVPFSNMSRLGFNRAGQLTDRRARFVLTKGLLASGRTVEQAASAVELIARQLDLEAPLAQPGDDARMARHNVTRPWLVRPAADIVINENTEYILGPLIATLMAAVALVLMVACTNLANMTLARATDRTHELALRRALGASRWRLVREQLIETGIVVLIGTAFGVIAARALMIVLSSDLAVGNGVTLRIVPRLDATVVVAAVLAATLALVIAGVVPAWQAVRADLRSPMAAGGSMGVPRWRWRRLLIAAQVTVSLVLVALAALCISQVREGLQRDRGFRVDALAVAEVDFATQQYDLERARAISQHVVAQLSRQPEIEAAAVSSGWPTMLTNPGASVTEIANRRGAMTAFVAASPTILETLDVTLASGRGFDERDTAGAPRVAILSRHLAEALFDDTSPLGREVEIKRRRWVGEPEHPPFIAAVIGVADDISDNDGPENALYLPIDQHSAGRLAFTVRTGADPARALTTLRQTIAAADPALAIAQVSTGESLLGTELVFLRVTGSIAAVLGSFALVLALAGLYGVLSHVISRRTREIGIRIALGADRGRILRMVIRDGVAPVVSGIVLGLAIGAIARMSLGPVFTRLAPAIDPVVLILVPVSMVLAAIVACYIPARRAAKIDPNVALRD